MSKPVQIVAVALLFYFVLPAWSVLAQTVNYKKALEINPEFRNATAAREIVKRLSSELSGK